MGFEPTVPLGTRLFESRTFDHSDISPCIYLHISLQKHLGKRRELMERTKGYLLFIRFRESHLRPLGQPSKLYLHPIRFGKWGELMGRTQRFFRFRTLENLHKSRLFRVERSTKRFRFRVLHLRPLGQLSVSIFIRFSFQKFA